MADAAGEVFPVHNNKFEFGTNGLESTDKQTVTPADLENFAPFTDGTMEEWFAMDTAGWAKTAMTDRKLPLSFRGRRSVGDPGNDYIAGLAWKFGQDVTTKFKWTMVSGATPACDVVVNVTTSSGGDTTDIDELEFEVASYGKSTFTPAASTV